MPRLTLGGRPPASWQPLALEVGPTTRRIETLLHIFDKFEALPDGRGRALARETATLYTQMNDRIRSIAVKTADIFEQEAKAQLNATQVRPDSQRGSAKLVDLIAAQAWDPNGRFAFGWVSMGLLIELDKSRNPYARTAKGKAPYWRAQEYGYTYTHPLTGYFVGEGGSPLFAPSQDQRRLHPMFAVSNKGGTFQAADENGVPSRPIEARGFLAHGREMAVAHWQGEMRRLDTDIARRVDRIVAQVSGTAGPRSGGGRRRRRR